MSARKGRGAELGLVVVEGAGKYRFTSEKLTTNRPKCGCFSMSRNLSSSLL